MQFGGLPKSWKNIQRIGMHSGALSNLFGDHIRIDRWLPVASSLALGILVFLQVLSGNSAADACCCQQDSHPSMVSDLSIQPSGQRVLMLQNGAIFKGTIEKVKGTWKIELEENATLIFQNHQVRVVADSIEDIYLFQSQRVSQFDVQQKTELLQWCMKHQLISQAERELGELSRLRIDPRLRKSLEVQLAQLKNPPQTQVGLAAGEATAVGLQPANPQTIQNQNPIVLAPAKAAVEAATVTNANSMLSANHSFSTESVDDESRKLPVSTVFKVYDVPGMKNPGRVQKAIDRQLSDESLQVFSQSTHQVVVEACAACHFENNQQMREDVGFELQIASKDNQLEATSHNLKQVMSLINRSNPGNSELLSIAFQAHGGMKKPPVEEKSLQQQTLVNWVYSTRLDSADPEIESRIQLAGVEMRGASQNGEVGMPSPLQPKSQLPPNSMLHSDRFMSPKANPANPYDPAAFNQMGSTDRYQLETNVEGSIGGEIASGQIAETQLPEQLGGKSAFEPQVEQEHIRRSLPRPTSMFTLPASKEGLRPSVSKPADGGTDRTVSQPTELKPASTSGN